MKDVRELVTLYSFVGSHNPYWRLSEECNILHFSIDETAAAEQTIELSPEQADRIREMTVITSSLLMTLPIDTDDIPVHLVGRKLINVNGLVAHQPGTTPLLWHAIWHKDYPLPNRSYRKPIQLS